MSHPLITIADAVNAKLNEGGFSLPFLASRRYVAKYQLKDHDALTVVVVPQRVPIEKAKRDGLFWDATVQIGVMQRVSPDDLPVLDGLMALVEEIVQRFEGAELSGINARQIETTNEPAYDVGHLVEWRQFTSVIAVAYRVMK